MNRPVLGAGSLLRSPWAVLAVALCIIGFLALAAGGSATTPPRLAATSARPDGALALALWLDRLHYRTQTTSDVSAHPPGGARGSLLLLVPHADVPPGQVKSTLNWVETGGRLVVVSDGSTGAAILRRLGLSLVSTGVGAVSVWQPVLQFPPTTRLAGTCDTAVTSLADDIEVAGTAAGPCLIQRRLGRGYVWVLSAYALLENGNIGKADNRALFLNLVGSPGSPVQFDEYVPPASAPGSGDWLVGTVWGAILLFLLATLLLYRWLAGRRLGPAVVPLKAGYRSLSEYVTSLAGLLRRARRREDVLMDYQTSLRRALGDRAEEGEAQTLLAPARSLSEGDLVRLAAAIVRYENEARSARD